ncbi:MULTISPECIES: streptophobe family protein [unclassified Streptomyces]|uniref:streptophobe family protein n=1 Tax=unclassified Streptomyces TaxID=2593676 RepID=UPI002E1040CA|nr:streptophobe family protein [Streptomyces sp. NBC_01197]WSS53149.1 streptophobe family protein [Streptomyces sp. NBC_01180]
MAGPGGAARNALEGALSLLAAVAAMAATGYAALSALSAGATAPLGRLTAAVTSMALGSTLTLTSGTSRNTGNSGGGLLGGLGGSSGGMSLGVSGRMAAIPLALTVLGTAVLAWGFFRPLRRRSRLTPALLSARAGGALFSTLLLFPALALLAHGTLHLPKSVTGKFGGGSGGGPGDGFGGGGGGIGGRLKDGLSSVHFDADPAAAGFFGFLSVALVLGLGCVAARRTTLPRPIALSRLRLKWNPVSSALTGVFAGLCCLTPALAALAGAAALTGRSDAAKAAGVLLLAGPNLLGVLLTSGLGSSWQAAVHRQQPQGGGLMGALGQGGGRPGGAADRAVDIADRSVAGIPVWLAGLCLLVGALVLTGYLAASRTPVRTRREEADALLGRHLELALRLAVATAFAGLVLPFLAHASARLGISAMGMDMGGLEAGLHGSVRLAGLTGMVLGGITGYCGSRLHGLRTARPNPAKPGGGSHAGRDDTAASRHPGSGPVQGRRATAGSASRP